jgi:hypothetical protein
MNERETGGVPLVPALRDTVQLDVTCYGESEQRLYEDGARWLGHGVQLES